MRPGQSSMQRESKKLLFDAKEAAERVVGFTAGKTIEDYESDLLLRSGVERQLEIAGEAMAQLMRLDEETALRVGAVQQIISFRNVLAHGYATMNNRLVWNVITEDLGALITEVTDLLAE